MGLALAGASALATVLGLILPWALARLGTDPAHGSGPLATIVQDVLSLVIYFACVTAVMLSRGRSLAARSCNSVRTVWSL